MKLRLAVLFIILTTSASFAAPLDVFRDCDACPEMIELPAGDFVMGAPDDEFRRNLVWNDDARGFVPVSPKYPLIVLDESPQHRVTIDIPFAMGRNEVTYDEWMACVADGGCDGYVPRGTFYRQGKVRGDVTITGSHPVQFISFDDAQRYIIWINSKLNTSAYRLPTEAEWEYAARAGTTTRFAQGDTLSDEQANFSGESSLAFRADERTDLQTRGKVVPVETLDAANGWGLRHMSGNASELTRSCYTDRYLGWTQTSVWLEESKVLTCERAYRGGGYVGPIDVARVAARNSIDQDNRAFFSGFRILKELTESGN